MCPIDDEKSILKSDGRNGITDERNISTTVIQKNREISKIHYQYLTTENTDREKPRII